MSEIHKEIDNEQCVSLPQISLLQSNHSPWPAYHSLTFFSCILAFIEIFGTVKKS